MRAALKELARALLSAVLVIAFTGTGIVVASSVSTGGNALKSLGLNQFAATTSAQFFGVISNETGSGAVVGATGPTMAAPSIIGTTTNDAACTGCVGQLIEGTLASGSATALTSTQAKTVTSIALTAGDWDVAAIVGWVGTPGSTTFLTGAISANDNSLTGTTKGYDRVDGAIVPAASCDGQTSIPPVRISVASTTTYYLVTQANFGSSSISAYGRISARRVR